MRLPTATNWQTPNDKLERNLLNDQRHTKRLYCTMSQMRRWKISNHFDHQQNKLGMFSVYMFLSAQCIIKISNCSNKPFFFYAETSVIDSRAAWLSRKPNVFCWNRGFHLHIINQSQKRLSLSNFREIIQITFSRTDYPRYYTKKRS